jgi:acetate kinase
MKAVHTHLPSTTNVACFDSSFHATIPTPIHTYAISPSIATSKHLRKYGFHGLSYSYIVRSISTHLSKPPHTLNLIALHLGSGASACAISAGASLDTSMGLTPVSGLPGATRSGDIDPSLVFHYTSNASKLSPSSTTDLHISAAEEILNKNSGWKALTGTSNFGEIAVPDPPSEMHRLAFELFVDRIVGFVGSYFVKLGGKVDALVFAGGIGEKSAYLRQVVGEKCACLGFEIDQRKNEAVDGVREIVSEIGTKMLVVRTDEDWEMAWRTMQASVERRAT